MIGAQLGKSCSLSWIPSAKAPPINKKHMHDPWAKQRMKQAMKHRVVWSFLCTLPPEACMLQTVVPFWLWQVKTWFISILSTAVYDCFTLLFGSARGFFFCCPRLFSRMKLWSPLDLGALLVYVADMKKIRRRGRGPPPSARPLKNLTQLCMCCLQTWGSGVSIVANSHCSFPKAYQAWGVL